ncbi:MAG: hypothetical protein HYR56_02195 [Acidobacteria bacterium]|nr:hypothetical protein [Acidobacteriota bacterium]MBI3421916.1 hypothetical protein [Acidobacteriota bacterium]
MSKRLIVGIVVSVFTLGLAALYAQDGPPGGRRGGGREMLRMFPLMAALDADGDGVLSAEEISNAAAALRKLDKNGDGQLTEEELRPNFPPGGPGGPGGFGGREGRGPEGAGGPNPDEMVKQLLEFDKNGDGQLQKAEVPERMLGLFERGDTNKDGVLSKEELRKLAETQSQGVRRDERDEHREGERRPQRPQDN